MFHSMKDIAVYLSDVSEKTGYDYDLLAVMFDYFIKLGMNAEEAVRRLESAAEPARAARMRSARVIRPVGTF